MKPRREPLIVIGAGGFGRETLDVVHAVLADGTGPNYDLLGVLDSNPSPENLIRLQLMGVEYLGPEQEWLDGNEPTSYLVGIGNPFIRRHVSYRFDEAGYTAAYAIHPQSNLGSLSSIAPGLVVCAGAQISTNVRFGRHVHVNANATVGHDAILGDYTSLNPGAIVSGDVTIGNAVLVGAGAVVLQGLKVGGDSTVGAGACVTRDVEPSVIVKGVPAR